VVEQAGGPDLPGSPGWWCRGPATAPPSTADRFDPARGESLGRRVAAGQPKRQAIGARLRKLVMIAYRVLKNRRPFDPAWSSRKTG
jgi:hypothetical protein